MRRLLFLLLALYLVFLGGGTYYTGIFALRVAHHVVITALLLYWLIHKLWRGRGIPPSALTPLVALSILVWLVASVLALDPRIALESAWFPITHALFFLVMIDLIQSGRQRLLMETAFMTAALVIIAALAQMWTWWGGWQPLLGADLPFPPVLPRLDQPFGVSTWLGGFAAPMITLSMGWALTVSRPDYRPPLIALAAAFIVILIFTASRGAYVSLAAGVAVLVVMRLWSRKALNRLILIAIGAGVIGVGLFAVIFLISRDLSRIGGDQLRGDLWRSSVQMIASDPLTGVGVGNFGRAHRTFRNPSYVDDRLSTAHNVYLNSAAELGIAGALLWIGLIGIGGRAWLHQWRIAPDDARKFRLEAAAAALIGIGIHSLFDTFTMTSTVLLPLLIAAYCVTPPRSVIDPPLRGSRPFAVFAAVLIAVYGLGLLMSDRAQAIFNSSVSTASLPDAQIAHNLDPSLRLYSLQIDYLTARDPNTPIDQAIAAYEDALSLEPTWDTGWLNLAYLYNQVDDPDSALTAFDRAAHISNWNGGWFAWAHQAEQMRAAPPDEIAAAYARSLYAPPNNADFWNATPIRQDAIRRFLASQSLEVRYRTLAALDPAAAQALIPADPRTAEAWFIVGHHALTVTGDTSTAQSAFHRAIDLQSGRGDFYTWRAYARAATDPLGAARDLDIAERLGAIYDSIPQARADLAPTPEARRAALITLVGSQYVAQNFEAVLFQGRRAQLETIPYPLDPLVSEAGLNAWYTLADDFIASGEPERAAQVYRLMLERFPLQERAREALSTLQESDT